VLGEKILDVAGILGDLLGPRAEAGVFVNGFHPFVEETSAAIVAEGERARCT
jgi:hypothetical protein